MSKIINSDTLQVKIDNKLKEDARKIYERLGLSLNEDVEAITLKSK